MWLLLFAVGVGCAGNVAGVAIGVVVVAGCVGGLVRGIGVFSFFSNSQQHHTLTHRHTHSRRYYRITGRLV